MAAADDFSTILIDTPDPGVARIRLNRPDKANAQSARLLAELDRALHDAARDETVKVIVLAAEGRHFSSGHDLAGDDDFDAEAAGVGAWSGYDEAGVAGNWAFEEDYYFGLCWRWRNLPKPTLVAVHGKVIAGGLMLVWPFDLVIAADDTTFQDPVVAFGVNGVEYFGHPWEFGVRKAKELLFTGRAITASVARELGMVNRVVPRDALEAETLALAREIAAQPMMGLKLAKESVNQAQNSQGLHESLRAAMGHQQMGHAHNRIVHGMAVDPGGAEIVKRLAKAPPLEE
jgi:enoyl-CoA hydratase